MCRTTKRAVIAKSTLLQGEGSLTHDNYNELAQNHFCAARPSLPPQGGNQGHTHHFFSGVPRSWSYTPPRSLRVTHRRCPAVIYNYLG